MMQIALAPLKALFLPPRFLLAEIAELYSTVRRYYPNPCFRRIDLRLFSAYLFRSPEAICSRYLRAMHQDRVQKIYGETTLTQLEAIADAVDLTCDDVVYDLGCGRGRAVFWLRAVRGCRAVGVDVNRYFVIQARAIQRREELDGVEFIFGNILDVDYNDATVLYLYGSAFSDKAIRKLVTHFEALRSGVRVISVSYPLNDYAERPFFEIEKTLEGRYPWGTTTIYIQRRI